MGLFELIFSVVPLLHLTLRAFYFSRDDNDGHQSSFHSSEKTTTATSHNQRRTTRRKPQNICGKVDRLDTNNSTRLDLQKKAIIASFSEMKTPPAESPSTFERLIIEETKSYGTYIIEFLIQVDVVFLFSFKMGNLFSTKTLFSNIFGAATTNGYLFKRPSIRNLYVAVASTVLQQ